MTLPAASLVGTVRPFWIFYLDFDGDPLRASTLFADYTPTGTGDADLDGFTFMSLPEELVGVSSVVNSEQGTDRMVVSLAGIPGPNDELLEIIGDPTKWRGKGFMSWHGLLDANFQPIFISKIFAGDIMSARVFGSSTEQTVEVAAENYLALLATPRSRTYQDQGEHDPTDISPQLMRSGANGIGTATGYNFNQPYGEQIRRPDMPAREPF